MHRPWRPVLPCGEIKWSEGLCQERLWGLRNYSPRGLLCCTVPHSHFGHLPKHPQPPPNNPPDFAQSPLAWKCRAQHIPHFFPLDSPWLAGSAWLSHTASLGESERNVLNSPAPGAEPKSAWPVTQRSLAFPSSPRDRHRAGPGKSLHLPQTQGGGQKTTWGCRFSYKSKATKILALENSFQMDTWRVEGKRANICPEALGSAWVLCTVQKRSLVYRKLGHW